MPLTSTLKSEWVELHGKLENPKLTAIIRELGERLRAQAIKNGDITEQDPYEVRCEAFGPCDAYSRNEQSNVVLLLHALESEAPRLKAVLWVNDKRVSEQLYEAARF